MVSVATNSGLQSTIVADSVAGVEDLPNYDQFRPTCAQLGSYRGCKGPTPVS